MPVVYDEVRLIEEDAFGPFVMVAHVKYRPLVTALRIGEPVRVHHVESAITARVMPVSGEAEAWGSGDPLDLPPSFRLVVTSSNPAWR